MNRAPYIEGDILLNKITRFLRKHKTTLSEHRRRFSDYFEMLVFNLVVDFYQQQGFEVNVQNLTGGTFFYKLSPKGNPQKFSWFSVEKKYQTITESFEIHHNLAVETTLAGPLFVTPDVVVINSNSITHIPDKRYYKTAYFYVPNKYLQTFFEVKNLTPFPELLFNYIGLFYSLRSDLFDGKPPKTRNPRHLAPSLVLSGPGNYHTNLIRSTLSDKFSVNIFFNLFCNPDKLTSKKHILDIHKIGTR